MKSNELDNIDNRCGVNFEKAFGKIAECCGLAEKIRTAGAVEEFQDFMISLERFYIHKMHHKQRSINKLIYELREKERSIETAQEDAEKYVQGVAKANPDLSESILNLLETAYIAGRNRI